MFILKQILIPTFLFLTFIYSPLISSFTLSSESSFSDSPQEYSPEENVKSTALKEKEERLIEYRVSTEADDDQENATLFADEVILFKTRDASSTSCDISDIFCLSLSNIWKGFWNVAKDNKWTSISITILSIIIVLATLGLSFLLFSRKRWCNHKRHAINPRRSPASSFISRFSTGIENPALDPMPESIEVRSYPSDPGVTFAKETPPPSYSRVTSKPIHSIPVKPPRTSLMAQKSSNHSVTGSSGGQTEATTGDQDRRPSMCTTNPFDEASF